MKTISHDPSKYEELESQDYKCWLRHKEYMDKKGYTLCVPEWWNYYEGRQISASYDKDLPRATENICAWVVDSQHATIIGTDVSLSFTCVDSDISTDKLKKWDEYVQKSIDEAGFNDKTVLDALVSSVGIKYYYYSDQVSITKGYLEGSMCEGTIDFEDYFSSNPRCDDAQKLKYQGFRKRLEVKAVRDMVDKRLKGYQEIVDSIVPDDFTNDLYNSDDDIEAGLVTVYTRFFRVNGEVYWTRSTQHYLICGPVAMNPDLNEQLEKRKSSYEGGYNPDDEEIYDLDPEMTASQDESLKGESNESYLNKKDKFSLYPIELLTLKPRKKCLYGRSQIEELMDNQNIINFMVAMTAKEIQDTAWSTVIMKANAANGQTWTGKPGGMFIDYTPGNTFGIKRLEGNQLNSQVMNYVSSLIDITKMLTGTNELVSATSNLKDVTAYALQILEEQRNKKIEILQSRYWRFLIRCAMIRLQFYKHYYPETHYMYELSDAEFAEEQESYNKLLDKPDEAFNPVLANSLGLPQGITNGQVASSKGAPSKVQRRTMDPKKEILGHFFELNCEAGKGSKYSEIIDMDLINNLFLNGGYEKMSPEAFEMWLALNSFMSESKKADIKILIEKQKQSQIAQLQGEITQYQEMLKVALGRVKMLEANNKQLGNYVGEVEKGFNERMNAANQALNYKDKQIQELMKNNGVALPSAADMAKEN